MRIAVIAAGKIGLPLAVQYASKGHEVTSVDINEIIVADVNQGRVPFPGEADLPESLERQVALRHLTATTDYERAVPSADAVVVVVPLLVDEEDWTPDFRAMDSATRSVALHLTRDTLVSYETTLPVGTTRNRWLPMIEEISGFKEGQDFHLVYSPERVYSGRIFADLRKYPKLIGALSDEGARKATDFYERVLDFDVRPDLVRPNGIWDLGSPEAAEMAKLAETTYRDVNIGLANQFASFAEKSGIDIYRVIEACNSQPFSHIHQPGIAVGGHCIPVYPRLYLSTDTEADIVRTARNFNASMPNRMVERAIKVLGQLRDLRVTIMGAAYRGGVKETAVSGVFPLSDALIKAGAIVSVHDPLYSDSELEALGLKPHTLGQPADVVILQADHPEYQSLGADDFPGIKLFLDGRNFTDPEKWFGTPRIVIGVA